MTKVPDQNEWGHWLHADLFAYAVPPFEWIPPTINGSSLQSEIEFWINPLRPTIKN
jgi:hypothetical protein